MTVPQFPLDGKRIFVAGHKGMVGAAILRRLADRSCELLTASRSELDLTRQDATERYLEATRPDAVIVAAARVGGIEANRSLPAAFIYENLAIATNVIHAAWATGVRKLVFLGSSCIYPRLAPQPMAEDALLTGPLEPSNEWYAVAKIAGIKLCQAYRRQYGADFVSVMPTNLFGPGDNYHPLYSHAPAALIRRTHEAKLAGAPELAVWGSGKPRREFLFVDDLADAIAYILENYSGDDILNVGTGEDIRIADFAELVKEAVGYKGRVAFDTSKPDGAPQKLLDVSRIVALGWKARTPLAQGLALTYQAFLSGAGRNMN